MSKETTHFGYKTIPLSEKTERVGSVFHSVATRYDIMNDLMSLGLHRLWKRIAVAKCAIRPHHKILDLAGGTGDLTQLLAKRLSNTGQIILSDINNSMLSLGRDKLLDAGCFGPITFVQANAENLPFQDDFFDCIIMGFGLRNVTHKETALKEMTRTLKPGGRVVILEFSQVKNPLLNKMYDAYSFSVLPLLGEIIAKDGESYQYLAESIRMHPDQDTLKAMMESAGLENCEYQNIHQGLVAIHLGFKF